MQLILMNTWAHALANMPISVRKLSYDLHIVQAHTDQLNRHESILSGTSWNLATRAIFASRL